MKRLLKIYLEKPELAGAVLLALLIVLFEIASGGTFLSYENVRGILAYCRKWALSRSASPSL